MVYRPCVSIVEQHRTSGVVKGTANKPTKKHTKDDHNSEGLLRSSNWRCEAAEVNGLPSYATTENTRRNCMNHKGANIAETETIAIHLLLIGGKLRSTNIEGCGRFEPPHPLLVVYFQQHPRPNGGVHRRALLTPTTPSCLARPCRRAE
ncbi:unnamed protein product [Ectocarpus sp. 12 AP-2014]